MAVQSVLKMGSPGLYKQAQRVKEFDTRLLHTLLEDMQDTMYVFSGAGLAAPQIGVSLQVVIFEVTNNPRYPEAELVPYTVLINPEITPLSSDKDDGWEGCLSIPGFRGKVPRYSHIRYTGFDVKGNRIDREVSGFHARVVQHECDHLWGTLYPMRIQDWSQFGWSSEFFPDQQ
jgi:peptide deformylase